LSVKTEVKELIIKFENTKESHEHSNSKMD
jgi:hypothetical protein